MQCRNLHYELLDGARTCARASRWQKCTLASRSRAPSPLIRVDAVSAVVVCALCGALPVVDVL